MLRKFIYSCISKDYIRAAQFGIRSNQVNCSDGNICNNVEQNNGKIKEGQNDDNGKNVYDSPIWESLIFKFSQLNSQLIHPLLHKYYNRNSNNTCNESLKGDMLHWVTGVLGVSSIILSHKWMHSRQNEFCPFVAVDVKHLKRLFENNLSRDHFLLAVSSGECCITEKPVKTKIDNEQEATSSLEISVEAFHEVVKECNSTLLNKMALKLKKLGHHKRAAVLFQQAAEYGHLSALFNLAICYELGQGVETSQRKAFTYYKQAADAGHCKSMYNVATFLYEGKWNGGLGEDDGHLYMEKAANLGLVQAQRFLALQFEKQRNWPDAVKYFKMAAGQNDVDAIFHLAVCYEKNLGVKKDLLKAHELYKKAADLGHTQAQFCLGDSYQNASRGVGRNYEEALKWYALASRKGHMEAANRLEFLKYEIAQRNEERVLSALESNPVSKLLQPIHNVVHAFHKSSSMPSLQLVATNNVAELPGKNCKSFHGSMLFPNQPVQYDFVRMKLTSEQLNAIL